MQADGAPGPPPLLTPRLSLRRWTDADVPDLVDVDDDARWRERDPRDDPTLVIRDRASGAFLGWISLAPFPPRPGQWELGFRLREEHWGRGYATEAGGAVLRWAWTRPEIDAVFGVHDPGNPACRRVMLKLGMADGEGLVEYPGEDFGTFPYCVISREAALARTAAGMLDGQPGAATDSQNEGRPRVCSVAAAPLSPSRPTALRPEKFAGRTERRLAAHLGLTQFGANAVDLAPGAWSSLAHWHEREDEFALVLAGTVVLVDGSGERTLRAGDCAGFPAGLASPHRFENRAGKGARLLVVGTRHRGREVIHYPEDFAEPVVVLRDGEGRRI
ncbi:acyl-CoA N-acyltransferase [Hyaloraphidium curvatum]|nr:acyl-CoA N-acyltransferase [Hyaloraphidium curvatum]